MPFCSSTINKSPPHNTRLWSKRFLIWRIGNIASQTNKEKHEQWEKYLKTQKTENFQFFKFMKIDTIFFISYKTGVALWYLVSYNLYIYHIFPQMLNDYNIASYFFGFTFTYIFKEKPIFWRSLWAHDFLTSNFQWLPFIRPTFWV